MTAEIVSERERRLALHRESSKRYYQRNREQIRAKVRGTRTERSRIYYLKNRERIISNTKKWQEENPERTLAKAADWYKKNKERALARIKHRAEMKRSEIRAYKRAYHTKNKARILARVNAWRARNPESARLRQLERRARKRNSCSNPKAVKEWLKRVLSKPTAICYYCQKITPSKAVHIDHIVPLSKGGPHSVENLCVACCACNLAKHTTLIGDWERKGQQVLAL